ncbi:MAG: hypothetical protein K5871_01120 [Lachnospiraceae bacterium]|nr:hypothetical protein [Lachnospiraceae bacterium]
MSELKLPRLLSDGAVFQHDKPIHVWGWDEPGLQIECELSARRQIGDSIEETDHKVTCRVLDDGSFSAHLPAFESGTSFTLKVSDEKGSSITVNDLVCGAVWFATGQSNMDLTFERLKDNYPEVIRDSENSLIRCFDITSDTEYSGPLDDPRTGEWKCAKPENMYGFSGTCYFFAKRVHDTLGIPVGMVHASLGGSHISSWMDKEMLADYPELIEESLKYGDPAFRESVIKNNEKVSSEWTAGCEKADLGREGNWKDGIPSEGSFEMNLPTFFSDAGLKDFVGTVWLQKKFNAGEMFAGKAAKLWLGTITDTDEAYVNGTFVGTIGYQYPPRKYPIPEGVIREGENIVVLRVRVDGGFGRVTPGKRLMIFNDECKADPWSNELPEGAIDLSGKWDCIIGCTMDEKAPATDPLNWHPMGLFNAMTAPCTPYPVEGILWYQGESDAFMTDEYVEFTKLQVDGYRRLWGDENIPYILAQLPNFTDGFAPSAIDEHGWNDFREAQKKITEAVPGTYMSVNMDAGEDNDLHPMNKLSVGTRLADIALDVVYPGSIKCPSQGPFVSEVTCSKTDDGYEIVLTLDNVGDGAEAFSPDEKKRGAIRDFSVASGEKITPVTAGLMDDRHVRIMYQSDEKPEAVRYLQRNTYIGEMIYNTFSESGEKKICKLMAPFIRKI